MLSNVSVDNSNIYLSFLFHFHRGASTCFCAWMGDTLAHTEWGPKALATILYCTSILFNEAGVLIKPRAHQTSPTWLIWWASLLWGIPCLPPSRLEVQAGHHACLSPAWIPGYKLWFSCFLDKDFNHGAIPKPGICLSNNRKLKYNFYWF